MRTRTRRFKRLIIGALALASAVTVPVWTVVRAPIARQTSPLLINDVSQLNPIVVNMVIAPTTTRGDR